MGQCKPMYATFLRFYILCLTSYPHLSHTYVIKPRPSDCCRPMKQRKHPMPTAVAYLNFINQYIALSYVAYVIPGTDEVNGPSPHYCQLISKP